MTLSICLMHVISYIISYMTCLIAFHIIHFNILKINCFKTDFETLNICFNYSNL